MGLEHGSSSSLSCQEIITAVTAEVMVERRLEQEWLPLDFPMRSRALRVCPFQDRPLRGSNQLLLSLPQYLVQSVTLFSHIPQFSADCVYGHLLSTVQLCQDLFRALSVKPRLLSLTLEVLPAKFFSNLYLVFLLLLLLLQLLRLFSHAGFTFEEVAYQPRSSSKTTPSFEGSRI